MRIADTEFCVALFCTLQQIVIHLYDRHIRKIPYLSLFLTIEALFSLTFTALGMAVANVQVLSSTRPQ